MREININRQLLGIEDLLFGFGQVTQTRAGQSIDITKINAGNLPFDETQSLLQWAQTANLTALGAITVELQAIYNSIDALNNLENNLVALNTLAQAINCLNNLCANLTKLQNIDTNMIKLQNIDTNMPKLQNIDTNMTKLQNIDTNMLQLSSIYTNMVSLQNIYTNMSSLLDINSQIIPHLSEILLVDDYAAQVALDKNTVASDKASVAAMKLAVETIYDTFDDRFLGTKTSDPTLDNDGNPLLDGAMYFNTSVNALKVYDLDNNLWFTIPQLYLSGLLDVTLTSITTGDLLTWNGSKWVNTRTPSFDSIKLNGGTGTNGTTTWNNTEHTYDIVLNPNVTLQVGQEDLVYCKNNSASVIANGRPVMASGTNGNSGNILVDLHDGTKANARRIVGIATEDLTANGYGFVTKNGKIRGINTTGSQYGETWANGDILYVKATGNLTKVEPADTELKMPIAFVIHAHTHGTLYVRTTGIDENHDKDFINNLVDINSKTAKTTLADADEFMTADSTSTFSLKKITWASIKTALTSLFAPVSSPTFSGTVSLPSTTSIGQVSSLELSYLDGVTSAIQAQINAKAATNQTMYVGTTAMAINRATAAQTLTGVSIDGNAATATKLTNSSGDWAASGASANVVGMLIWKNYGNGHVIFDASASTAPNGTAVNNTNAQIGWSSSYPTLMGWNGSQTYGVRVDAARVADAFSTTSGSAPSYACRAWVNFNGTGTVAIRASGNVSSITDNGTGVYTVNFTTAMPDANYSFAQGVNLTTDGDYPITINETASVPKTTTALKVVIRGKTGGFGEVDSSSASIQIFR